MRILGISGSLRRGSYSSELLRTAQELAPAEVEFAISEGLAGLPFYDQDLEDEVPAAVEKLRRAIDDADALLIITPEYNGSVPGGLKNALDWASRPHGTSALAGKPVAVVGNSPSPFGGAWAQEHLRRVLALSGSVVLERETKVGRVAERFTGEELTDIGTREELTELTGELIEMAEARTAESVVPVAA